MVSQIKASLTKTIDTKKEETYFDALNEEFLNPDDKISKDFGKRLNNENCPMDFCAKDAPN